MRRRLGFGYVFDQLATKHPGQQRAATTAPHRAAQLTRQATADVRESDGGSREGKRWTHRQREAQSAQV
jgi:hypothetical protein